jgi:hypothetical protein
MDEYPRSVKRQLRTLAALAYENELRQALLQLAGHVDAWRANQISAGELNERIHQYDTGLARELYSRYNNASPVLQVACAIVEGILQESDIPAEVWPYLQNALAFYRGLDQERR